jgi:hypothetical protein
VGRIPPKLFFFGVTQLSPELGPSLLPSPSPDLSFPTFFQFTQLSASIKSKMGKGKICVAFSGGLDTSIIC